MDLLRLYYGFAMDLLLIYKGFAMELNDLLRMC